VGTTYNYAYNKRGRLAELSIGSTVTADYTYDGLERLAIRTTENMTPAGAGNAPPLGLARCRPGSVRSAEFARVSLSLPPSARARRAATTACWPPSPSPFSRIAPRQRSSRGAVDGRRRRFPFSLSPFSFSPVRARLVGAAAGEGAPSYGVIANDGPNSAALSTFAAFARLAFAIIPHRYGRHGRTDMPNG
jgi:hypothetical protein